MIRINRNHPSVIIWSMGNELFFPMGQSDMQVRKDLVNEMRNLAHLLDPTRKAGMGGVQRKGFDTLTSATWQATTATAVPPSSRKRAKGCPAI